MIGIERYAYCNPWRKIHPGEKMAFALCTLFLSLLSPELIVPLFIFIAMGLISVGQARIPLTFYLKLLILPTGFLLAGTGAVAVSISPGPLPLLFGWEWGKYTIGITEAGLHLALLLFIRALGAVSCLYFLMLTTPLEEITGQLHHLRVPSLLIELMVLVYRFIFVLWESAVTIHTAQAARMGHRDWRTGLRSLASLISSLFIRSFYRAENLHWALVSRGYNGSISILEEEKAHSWPHIVYFAVIDLLLLFMILYKEGVLL